MIPDWLFWLLVVAAGWLLIGVLVKVVTTIKGYWGDRRGERLTFRLLEVTAQVVLWPLVLFFMVTD